MSLHSLKLRRVTCVGTKHFVVCKLVTMFLEPLGLLFNAMKTLNGQKTGLKYLSRCCCFPHFVKKAFLENITLLSRQPKKTRSGLFSRIICDVGSKKFPYNCLYKIPFKLLKS